MVDYFCLAPLPEAVIIFSTKKKDAVIVVVYHYVSLICFCPMHNFESRWSERLEDVFY